MMTYDELDRNLEDLTKNAAHHQLQTLHSILQHQASVGYLQPYLSACHAPVDAATFRSQVPLSSYDDYFHLINQLANGDIDHHQPLLSADPLLCFFYRYCFDFFFKPNSKKKKKKIEEKKKPILYQIIIYVLILLLWYQYNEAYLVSDYNLYFNFVALALVQ
jgi:hypothetical protein